LTTRLRKIALALASGETTKAVAKMFDLSPARISQLRAWLKKSWEEFQGEADTGGRPQPTAA
jgi:transposase-like protein